MPLNPMKNASELFAQMSPALADEALGALQQSAKPTYRMAVETLAGQQKLRAVFLERKPRPERHAWLQRALARPANGPVAANLLQMWLVNSQAPMLCDFLDSLHIPHDGKGSIEDLPACPGPEPLRAAVDGLLAKDHPAERVAVYLHCFAAMDPEGWAPLDALLQADPRLQLHAGAAAH